MNRRDLITGLAVGCGGAAIAKPAIAQSQPAVRWRLSSAFPKSLDTIYGANDTLSRLVAEATDGQFQIQPFGAGEIVGTFQAADAVGNGTVDMVQTTPYYYVGKDPTFALGCTIPFGMNSRQMNAWLYQGGGEQLLNKYYAKHGFMFLPGGNTGAQMGGWFRREMKSLEDLKGLKMRIAGIAGQVMAKLGVVPQQISGGDIYPALERGTIDAAEWVGPADDEKLGFNRVAPYYYYPGWWEGGAAVHLFVNLEQWSRLPKNYKACLQSAAGYAAIEMQARYDARNPPALKRLVAAGAQLRAFPNDVMQAAAKSASEIYDEISAKNADFKAIYEAYRDFRNDQYLWFQLAEYGFDTFMIRSRQR
jgi:TRAP-type mannitol/chloroaromatic compound transport system substrate-binding protein